MPENASRQMEGQGYVEFDLKLPAQTISYANQMTIAETQHIVETVFGYNHADISFRVTTQQFVDKILKALDSAGNPIVRWRMGIGLTDSIEWIPWQIFYVLQFSAMYEGIGPSAGHYVKLYTRDAMQRIDRVNKTQSHRGTISAIVKKLAQRNGLDSVVEDTQGEGVWVQSYEGDFEFVRRRLVQRARSTRGRGNYCLYVRDNVLHFHTVEYQTLVKDFNFYASPATKLEAIDAAQAKINDGSAGVRVIYYDPYTGKSKEALSDPNRAMRLANSMPRLDKLKGSERNVREHRVQIRNEEAGAAALSQNMYEFARSECFQLKMQTSKTNFIRPGELLRINIDPNADTISAWSGLYLVATASHLIEHGELNSVYILQRGEQSVARTTSNALAAYGVDTIQDEQNALGYDINVRDAQTSTLTKGAGKSTAGNTYLTVQDKNSALTPTSQ